MRGMRVVRVGASLVLVLASVGCASLESVTSGQIGCAESDITISNDEQGWNSRTWTAECHGKTYYCSGQGGGKYNSGQVSCAEAEGEVARKDQQRVGCHYDTQCKGDRVCRRGECVDE